MQIYMRRDHPLSQLIYKSHFIRISADQSCCWQADIFTPTGYFYGYVWRTRALPESVCVEECCYLIDERLTWMRQL